MVEHKWLVLFFGINDGSFGIDKDSIGNQPRDPFINLLPIITAVLLQGLCADLIEMVDHHLVVFGIGLPLNARLL